MEPRGLGGLLQGGASVKPLIFFAPCIPKGQPRVRACRRGSFSGVYTPDTADEFKAAIQRCAKQSFAMQMPSGATFGRDALRVDWECVFPRPKAHFTSKGQIKPTSPSWHIQKPDRDNLDKAILDSLTTIAIWQDDCQVCSGLLTKRWAALGETSGVQITITAIQQ